MVDGDIDAMKKRTTPATQGFVMIMLDAHGMATAEAVKEYIQETVKGLSERIADLEDQVTRP